MEGKHKDNSVAHIPVFHIVHELSDAVVIVEGKRSVISIAIFKTTSLGSWWGVTFQGISKEADV